MVSNRIIKIDLNKKTKNVVQMVQGDTNRKLTINVYDSDEPYLVNGVGGETIHGAVYIEKPDGTTCGYDTLEDDSPAVTGSGNTLTVYFVPQATTAHGWAYMTVSVFDDDGVELNTFGIDLFIDKKATAEISADYWNLKSIEGLTAAVEGLTQQMVRSVNFATPDSNGNVTLLPWQIQYNGVVGGQQVGDVEEALDRLARMQADIIDQSIKDALVNALSHVAWTDEHGQDYVDALEQAMRSKLVSISAVFTQGSAVIYDTDDLDTLRQYLTVTALYSDTTTRTVTAYTLSGTLTVGTDTITVSYGGKTTTFAVMVTEYVPEGWLYHFEDTLASSGTKDFNFTGVAAYGTGPTGRGKAFYHHVGTEGTASTDPLGIYATGLTDVPDLSGDFTIAFWAKAVTATSSHPLVANKYYSDAAIPSVVDAPTNVASGWTVNKVMEGTLKYKGIRIVYISGVLVMTLNATDNSAVNYSHALPSGTVTTQWHHYALTRKNGMLRFFFDGSLIWSITYTKTLVFADQICIGNNFGTTAATATQPTKNAASDYVDDLYVAEFCKWESEFDPYSITY